MSEDCGKSAEIQSVFEIYSMHVVSLTEKNCIPNALNILNYALNVHKTFPNSVHSFSFDRVSPLTPIFSIL